MSGFLGDLGWDLGGCVEAVARDVLGLVDEGVHFFVSFIYLSFFIQYFYIKLMVVKIKTPYICKSEAVQVSINILKA